MIYNNLAKKNSINNFLNTYFNLFVVIFVSILLVMSYFLILKPKVEKTTTAISENITSHQKILQAEKTKLASLEASVAVYNNIDKIDLERVNRILPNDYDKELLYGEIEEIISKNGFMLTSITLNKEGEESKVATAGNGSKEAVVKVSDKIGIVNLSLNLASVDYAGLKSLLNILENSLRIFDVKSLGLNGSTSASLELTTYYYKK